MNGIVKSVISNFAIVESENQEYICKLKGSLVYQKKVPITGDQIEFVIDKDDSSKGTIITIFNRKNELYRPKIANIDQVVIITSLKKPNFSTFLLNKYLSYTQIMQLKIHICFTKYDLVLEEEKANFDKEISIYKKMGYNVSVISNKEKDPVSWQKFENELDHKVSVFTGQTGSGKSTTLNTIFNDDNLIKTQEISESLNRGKHTTTTTKLYKFRNGLIGDTPGFSSFELKNISKLELAKHFPSFSNFWIQCKFGNCIHINEISCKIKSLLKEGVIEEFLYTDYKKLILELDK